MQKKYLSPLSTLLFVTFMGFLALERLGADPSLWRILLILIGIVGMSFMSGVFFHAAYARDTPAEQAPQTES